MRWSTLRSQAKLTMAMMPPARTPSPALTEKRMKRAALRTAVRARLPLTMTAKRLSSLIAVVIFADLPAGYDVDVLETGRYPDKEKDIKEPWLGAEPAVERQAEPDADP